MRTIRCISLLGFLLITSSQFLNAWEEEEDKGLWDKIFFGGNFGLQFGTITNIEISPLVGYHLTPKLSAGTGIRYEYYRSSVTSFFNKPVETNIYGLPVFTRYMLFKELGGKLNPGIASSLFGHAEYEILSLERRIFEVGADPMARGRFLAHSVLLGGGLFQPTGTKGGFFVMMLWNLNESANSPYNNPIIRIGFIF